MGAKPGPDSAFGQGKIIAFFLCQNLNDMRQIIEVGMTVADKQNSDGFVPVHNVVSLRSPGKTYRLALRFFKAHSASAADSPPPSPS